MNLRTLLIILALALPPVALGIIVQSGGIAQKNNKLSTGPATPNSEIKKGAISNEPVRLPPLEMPRYDEKVKQAAKELKSRQNRVKRRLDSLLKMNPADWPAERKRNRRAPATLAEAIERNTYMLGQLHNITAEEWAAGQRPERLPPARGADKAVTTLPATDPKPAAGGN